MLNIGKRIPKLYQVILDSIADGVYTVDLDWRLTSFNKAAEKITGIQREDAIGRKCFEVLRSNMCENHCLLKRAMDARQPISDLSFYIIRADKKRIPINVTTAVLKSADNQVIGGVMSFRDLSHIKKLRKELYKHCLLYTSDAADDLYTV